MQDELADGPPIEQYRPYLWLLARVLLEPKFRRQLDPSDVVQEVYVRACKAIHQYRGTSEAELRSWMREILLKTLKEHARALSTQKRDIDLERDFEDALNRSSARLEVWIQDSSLGPAERAEREDELDRIAKAINDLPEDQRTAFELFYIHECPVKEIGQRMDRTTNAAGALIQRAVKAIRKRLNESS
jgi:RNA polymerase sigma-70 factor (ECF subfamily)